jgi:outer membrane lipoprotein-sorting protein
MVASFLFAVLQAASPDPIVILEAAGRTYRNAKSYHLATSTTIVRPEGRTDTLSHVIAGVKPSQFREEVQLSDGSFVLLSDGVTTWAYFPEARQYVAAAANSPEAHGYPFVAASHEMTLNSYAQVAEHIVAAKWLRADTLVLGGTRLICDVIAVERAVGVPLRRDPEADRAWRDEWNGGTTTYWIDRSKHRVLKETTTSTRGAQMTTLLRVAKIDEPLPLRLFRFSPPKGASRIELSDLPR